MDWQVESASAVTVWVSETSPTPSRELDMMVWADGLQWEGPPFVIDFSPRGLPIAEGPNGERIEHAVIPRPLGAEPPYADIFIVRITDP